MSACSETKFRALDLECPVCHADPDKPCVDKDGQGNVKYRAPHVERGRQARWTKTGMK